MRMTLAIPSNTIWTPRFGPWWRKPWRSLATLMADHLKYGSGNHLLYGPGGHLVYECPSDEPTGPETHDCDTCEALSYTLTITGWTFACTPFGSGFPPPDSQIIGDGNLDGTFNVPLVGTCTYEDPTWNVYQSYYGRTDCSGSPDDTLDANLLLVFLSSTSARVRMGGATVADLTGITCIRGVDWFTLTANSGITPFAGGTILATANWP